MAARTAASKQPVGALLARAPRAAPSSGCNLPSRLLSDKVAAQTGGSQSETSVWQAGKRLIALSALGSGRTVSVANDSARLYVHGNTAKAT